MIFDLRSGKRRRLVQVVFSILAFIFAISFIGFGIGSGNSGGLFDALGIGGGNSGGGSTNYDDQIEDAENTLETEPENQRALTDLINYHFLAASEGIETDQTTGATSISEDARSQLEDTVSAWQDYLDTKPQKPDTSAAATATQAYVYLQDAGGAADAQRIVAEAGGTAADFGQLALYLYADGNIKAGDEAGEQAVAAAEPSERVQIRKYTEQLAEQARKQEKQLAQQADQKGGDNAAESQLEDPFGGLTGGASTPTAP